MGQEGVGKFLHPQILLRVGKFRGFGQGQGHFLPLDAETVLAVAENGDAVALLGIIYPLVGADLKLGLLPGGSHPSGAGNGTHGQVVVSLRGLHIHLEYRLHQMLPLVHIQPGFDFDLGLGVKDGNVLSNLGISKAAGDFQGFHQRTILRQNHPGECIHHLLTQLIFRLYLPGFKVPRAAQTGHNPVAYPPKVLPAAGLFHQGGHLSLGVEADDIAAVFQTVTGAGSRGLFHRRSLPGQGYSTHGRGGRHIQGNAVRQSLDFQLFPQKEEVLSHPLPGKAHYPLPGMTQGVPKGQVLRGGENLGEILGNVPTELAFYLLIVFQGIFHGGAHQRACQNVVELVEKNGLPRSLKVRVVGPGAFCLRRHDGGNLSLPP